MKFIQALLIALLALLLIVPAPATATTLAFEGEYSAANLCGTLSSDPDCFECNIASLARCSQYQGHQCRSTWNDGTTYKIECDGLPPSLVDAWSATGTFRCWVGEDGALYCQ
jgi:hypothetical protein